MRDQNVPICLPLESGLHLKWDKEVTYLLWHKYGSRSWLCGLLTPASLVGGLAPVWEQPCSVVAETSVGTSSVIWVASKGVGGASTKND